MKINAFILLLLFLLCGGNSDKNVVCDSIILAEESISQPQSEDITLFELPNKDFLLTSSQSAGFAEEQITHGGVQIFHNGRVLKSLSKHGDAVVKCGKIVRQSAKYVIKVLSGELSSSKYLFFVRKLRI